MVTSAADVTPTSRVAAEQHRFLRYVSRDTREAGVVGSLPVAPISLFVDRPVAGGWRGTLGNYQLFQGGRTVCAQLLEEPPDDGLVLFA